MTYCCWRLSADMTDGSTEEQIEPAGWVDRFGDFLYRYALSRLRDAESAEEVVQETVCKDLGISSSYLWVLLYRARLRLAKCMTARGLAEEGR